MNGLWEKNMAPNGKLCPQDLEHHKKMLVLLNWLEATWSRCQKFWQLLHSQEKCYTALACSVSLHCFQIALLYRYMHYAFLILISKFIKICQNLARRVNPIYKQICRTSGFQKRLISMSLTSFNSLQWWDWGWSGGFEKPEETAVVGNE